MFTPVSKRLSAIFLSSVYRAAFTALVLAAVLIACGAEQAEERRQAAEADDERPVVTVTFTILSDFAREVAGDRLRIRNITPAGAEVHEYELGPRDFVNLEEADLVLYNGYMIEQWMPQVREMVRSGTDTYAVAELTGAETIPIQLGEYRGSPDPHLWMNPGIAIRYVETIRDIFTSYDPEGSDIFEANAADYIERLEQMHEEAREALSNIGHEDRVLITSEAAFHYFADAYDFYHAGIWGTNHEDEGTPEQLARVVDVVQERRPGAIFFESTISDRHVRSVSDDTGVPVVGPLFVDSTSDPDGEAPTYIDMIRVNALRIAEALGR